MEFDNVKAEKANAIARYRRFRNLTKLLQVIEVFVVLTLVSWSWTRLPNLVNISGEYIVEFSVYIFKPHVVFVIGNAIVILLFLLSPHYDCGNDVLDTDIYNEYVEDNNLVPQVSSQEEVVKEITCYDKNVVSQNNCEAAATAIQKATRQIQRFQRTQSEKLKREIKGEPKRVLRRSETVIRREVVPVGDGFGKVESLSNEEFRLTIEAFIEKQQRFLWAQKMAEPE